MKTGTLIAIDPGTTESAHLEWNGNKVCNQNFGSNTDLINNIRYGFFKHASACVIEMVACYGMPVGKETFQTVLWIGQFMEAWSTAYITPCTLVYRQPVKIHHCGSARAKDGNVRQALIDKYGAPGTKKEPGRTYGVSGHLWSALALATFSRETGVA